MMQLSVLLLLTAMFSSVYSQTETYFVSAMRNFRPGQPYRVSVTVFGTTNSNWDVAVSLKRGIVEETRISRILNVGATKAVSDIFDLQPGANLKDGKYVLDVVAKNGQKNWKNSTSVNLLRRNNMIMIQTDKGLYKPGSEVKFRVFAIDLNLVPVTGVFDIFIKDAKGNRVEQWKSVSVDAHGVFSSSFQLQMVTPLGNWTLEANFKGEKESVSFAVEEYVLPRYEVTVKLPPYILTSAHYLTATVDAQYTYGEAVEGDVTIEAYVKNKYEMSNKLRRPFVTIKESQKGSKQYNIPLSEFLTESQNRIEVIAKFTDKLGGEEREGSATVSRYQQKWKVDFSKTPDVLKPQLPFKVRVRVTEQDGTPPSNPANLVIGYKFSIRGYWCLGRRCPHPVQQYRDAPAVKPDSDGNAVIDIGIPANSTQLSLKATYDGADLGSHKISKTFQTLTDQNIEITINEITEKVLSFNVRATFDAGSIFYQVTSKGQTVLSNEVTLDTNKKATIKETLDTKKTALLAPKARIIVYALYNNEIIADFVQFHLDGIFKYKTTLSYDSDKKKVGDKTTLTVKTQPNAYVGVSAIDQSVLLLKKGNDIDEETVIDGLEKFYAKDTEKRRPFVGRPVFKRSVMPFYFPDITSSHAIFMKAGLVYMSNAAFFFRSNDHFLRKNGPIVEFAGSGGKTTGSEGNIEGETNEQVRKDFPESWLWMTMLPGANGVATHEATVPDSITSYVTNAFALHPSAGLSVLTPPVKLTAFKTFYVTPVLLYSIILGEKFNMKVIVYNYLEPTRDVKVNVKVYPSADFTVTGSSSRDGLEVIGDSGREIEFEITPKKLKFIEIKISAEAPGIAKDTVIKSLLVKPEGKTVYGSKSFFVDGSKKDASFIKTMQVSFPTEYVADTRRIEAVVMGDVMGPALKGLDSLVRVPTGCGEQNMVTLVPSISVRKYLNSMGTLSQELSDKTTKYIKHGYQRELAYQRKDKSFSAFGDRDNVGSTWLTAFVAQTFFVIDKMYPGFVDDQVLSGALTFIIQKQNSDGSFREDGRVIHKRMQGGASKGVTLTAYVLSTLASVPQRLNTNQITRAVAKTKTYLKNEYLSMKQTPRAYPFAILAYTFVVSGESALAQDIISEMMKISSVNEEGKKYWSDEPAQKVNAKRHYNAGPSAVEISGYVLMTLTKLGKIVEGVPIMEFLLGMRNSKGGYLSTQDTVIGLQSLADYAAAIYRPGAGKSMKVQISLNNEKKDFTVSDTNARLYQSYAKDEPSTNEVRIVANGGGVALIQISWSYNVKVSKEERDKEKTIVVTATASFNKARSFVSIRPCLRMTSTPSDQSMTVMECNMPSGMVADMPDGDAFDKVENKDGKLVFYMKPIKTTNDVCIPVTARVQTVVKDRKDVVVSAYDYYDTESTFSTVAYSVGDGTSAADWSVSMSITLTLTAVLLQVVMMLS